MDAPVRALLDEESSVIRQAHFSGAGGGEVVQRRTALIDRILREVHRRAAETGPLPTLVAVGGYGRGELNPHSDIDILLLCGNEAERERSPEILYQLWDAGLDVGYSVRTVPECVDLGRRDIRIRTSLMESRLIAGAPERYEGFVGTMQSEVLYWKVGDFLQEKLAERQAVRNQYGGSIYLRQPNIKDGTGGLRDLHTAFWVSAVRYRISTFADLVPRGILSAGQYAQFLRSRNFLWRIRNELHYCSSRKNDHLTFDLQERAAKDFGYRDSGHLLGVERMMKVYFSHARSVGEFSNIVMEAALRRRGRSAPFFQRAIPLGEFSLVGRTIIPASESAISEKPTLILKAFTIMQSHQGQLSDRLKELIASAKIDESVRTSSEAASLFLSMLDHPAHLFETLGAMKRLRFLGRYLPEFRAIQALAKHDYYHTYTVDEHTLFAIRNIQELWSGLRPVHDSLVNALRSVQKRWVLMLAVLLHDLGKAYRTGHEHRGVDLARRVLQRLGVAGDEESRVLFLVRNHLLMNSLSQRRELTDRNVIARFAARIKDRENLDLLYLLTFADVAAVSPGAWTQWRASLLLDLYQRTVAFFEARDGQEEEERARIDSAIARIVAAGRELSREEIDAFVATVSTPYLLHTPARKAVDHLLMLKRLPEERLVIGHRHYPDRGYTELTVCAYDAYGMLSLIAGTLAAKNLNVLRAQVFTTRTGVMVDSLQVTDAEGNILEYEEAWESVEQDLREVLVGRRRPPAPGALAGRVPSASGPASVEFDNDTSDDFTIIDVTGPDRVGMLYRLTRMLYELNLDIGSAKVVTEGARILDSFYVTDLFRRKIVDGERLMKIREALLAVLSGRGEP